MTNAEKLAMLKSILTMGDSEDERLTVYLSASEKEILAWRYSYVEGAKRPLEVPSDLEMTQLFSVVAGYSQSGAENQSSHSENGIGRSFVYADMIHYIRANVIPFAAVL